MYVPNLSTIGAVVAELYQGHKSYFEACTRHIHTCEFIPLLTHAKHYAVGPLGKYIPNLGTIGPVVAEL